MSSIVVTMTPDEQRLWRAQQKLIAQTKDLDGGYKKVGAGAKKAGKDAETAGKQQQSFVGSKTLTALAGVAAGYAGVTQAIALVNAGLTETIRLRDEAARRAQGAAPQLAMLAQVSKDEAEYQKLVAASYQTWQEGATKELGPAAGLIFALQSSGAMHEREFFSRAGSSGVVGDPAKLANATTTLQNAFGMAETGSLQDITSKGFAAGNYAHGDLEQLLEGASRGAGSARALGLRDEDVLAAQAILSSAMTSPENAATTLAALLVTAQKKGLSAGDAGLLGILDEIQGKGLEGADLFEYFGTAEAVKAFDAINLNRDKYSQALAEINVAAENNVALARMALPGTNESVDAVQQRQKAEAAYAASAEDRGTGANLAAAAVQWRKSKMGAFEAGFVTAADYPTAWLAEAVGAIQGDEHRYERQMLEDYLLQDVNSRRGGLDFAPAETKEEREFQVQALNRLDAVGGKLSAAAENFRAASQQQSNYTSAARLSAQGARAD